MPARCLAAVLLCALAAGLIGLAMARFLEGVELVFYGVDAPSLPDRVAQAGWRSALAPAAGGLGAGLFWWWERATGGVVTVRAALADPSGGVARRMGLVRPCLDGVVQVLTVGAGNSVGREGAPRLMAGAVAARVSSWLGLGSGEAQLLVAASAGAGLTAMYNAPLGGAVYALEVVLALRLLPRRHAQPRGTDRPHETDTRSQGTDAQPRGTDRPRGAASAPAGPEHPAAPGTPGPDAPGAGRSSSAGTGPGAGTAPGGAVSPTTWPRLRATALCLVVSLLAAATTWVVDGNRAALALPVLTATAPTFLALPVLLALTLPLGVGARALWARFAAHHPAHLWGLPLGIGGAGLLTGVASLALPLLPGNGRDALGAALVAPVTASAVLVMLGVVVLKPLLTGLTLGAGATGGLLAPSFALGGCAGAVVGIASRLVGWDVDVAALALAGGAVVLSVTQRAPLFGAVFVWEIVRGPVWYLPVMVAVTVLATTASEQVTSGIFRKRFP
ncbi:chloride channel protein [Actinomyces sp. oral taxon 897]|uniref:chloride channel protein n=1 Tax=Actinomyces sp. oral taxon 897 TaxID=2081702 RepID=UPI000D03E441|nr:chloride channel protein [Actinomyces sp. oral taxon 897]AVM60931.1 chemotaxis protein CheW [Actinomyces sp. oral taxon 897]